MSNAATPSMHEPINYTRLSDGWEKPFISVEWGGIITATDARGYSVQVKRPIPADIKAVGIVMQINQTMLELMGADATAAQGPQTVDSKLNLAELNHLIDVLTGARDATYT